MRNSVKLKTASLILIVIATVTANAQSFNISWSNNTKMKYDFNDAVQLDNVNMMILKVKEKKRFGSIPTYIPVLMLVNANKDILKENEISLKEINPTVIGFKKLGNHIFLVYENFAYSNRTTSIYFLEIDKIALSVISKKEIINFRDNKATAPNYSFSISPDSSKLLLFVELPQKMNDNEKFSIVVFDDGMNKIWGQEVELPTAYKYIILYDEDVTDNGKVFISLKHFDKEVSRQMVKEDGNKVPSYSYKIFTFSKNQKQKEVSFKLDKKFVQGTKLIYNKNGTVTAAGLYKNHYDGSVNGVFYTTFNADNPIFDNPKLVELPSEMVKLVVNDDFGGKRSEPGLSVNFKVNNIIVRNNGSIDLISEYIKVTESRSQVASSIIHDYVYGDIINVNIDKAGKAVFTRIPKKQEYIGSPTFLGYYPLLYKDNLLLIYNDDKNNISRDINKSPNGISKFKNSVLAAATIDAQGNLIRQSIYTNSDEDFITIPKEMSKISETSYLITADNSKLLNKSTRYGIVKVNN
jgi:hypothetical protein